MFLKCPVLNWQAHDKIDKQDAELSQQLYNPHLYKQQNKQAPAKDEKVSFLEQVGIISDGQKGLKDSLKLQYPGLEIIELLRTIFS